MSDPASTYTCGENGLACPRRSWSPSPYGDLLDYVISAALFFYILTVAGVVVLRWRRPALERPSRIPRSVQPTAAVSTRYWRLYSSNILDKLHIAVEEHDRILLAIRKGEPEQAEAAMAANWVNGAERIGKVIAQQGDLGTW